jgi:N-acetylmuramic acid 6-phosphate etherase
VLKSIDLRALRTLERCGTEIDGLTASVDATLARGRRVFLCGCGATGRLSLSLEFLWRQDRGSRDDRVVSFMAGGDVALVHSLEGFEDYPSYGARHLREVGFEDGDLLISCTEGGETPYVIGATEEAAKLSSNPPYFLYCNADSALADRIERFRRVYDNPSIRKICLYVGPMALAGSTRMQASTVLQLAVGLALLHSGEPAKSLIADFHARVREADLSFLTELVEKESDTYLAGHHVHYRVKDYGITVFTDTTERAPTFSLVPFDQLREQRPQYSLCYVSLEEAESSADAWLRLLNRRPRPLDWPEVDPRTTPGYLRGFDFSINALERRRRRIPGRVHREFRIHRSRAGIGFRLDGLSHEMAASDLPDLFQHLLLKQVLNIHSTLVMGRLGRYENNLMTWVLPTNGKLVDRAARYVERLLANAGRTNHSYEDIVRQLFAEMDVTEPGESVVLRTYNSLLRNGAAR